MNRRQAGLSEAALPIRLEGSLIGYAMLGQFRSATALSADMLAEWSKAKHDLGKLPVGFEDAPYSSRIYKKARPRVPGRASLGLTGRL